MTLRALLRRITAAILVLGALWAGSACSRAEGDFTEQCRLLAENARKESRRAVRGADDNWLFLTREVEHLAEGEFWTKNWEETAVNGQNPAPFILYFHRLLEEKGIELILAPVPAKAAIYPGKLIAGAERADPATAEPFYAGLREEGIRVLDLESVFREMTADEKVYCAQDTHWSPRACEKTAELIHELFEEEEWAQKARSADGRKFVLSKPEKLEIRGDLVGDDEAEVLGKESLEVRYAGIESGDGLEAVAPDSESPVLLLGDSHTLVFQEGASNGLHCDRAGLLDQLQNRFGFAIDLVGVRGSGSGEARRSLFRHAASIPGYWDGKKLVIWCFSAREFTQSPDKLLEIPLERG